MSKYDHLDVLILEAVGRGDNPLYARQVDTEARRLADEMRRDAFRVIDGRLSALKKCGHIVHRSKKAAKADGAAAGWSFK